MKDIKRKLSAISAILLIVLMFPVMANCAMTAEQVASRTASLVSNKNGMTANFSISVNGRNVSGKVKTSGNKFMVALPQMSSWYNGKTLYTYNAGSNETTVVTPTARELMDTNPLLYVQSGKGYSCSFSKTKVAGKYIVDITPTAARSGIKKLTVTINAKTFYPEKIVVTMNGQTSTINVTGFKSGIGSTAADFEYPRSRYPKAEIVDLR